MLNTVNNHRNVAKQLEHSNSFIQNKSKNIAFSAQEYPSGTYSDWFIAEVKPQMDKTDSEYQEWINNKLAIFKKKITTERPWYDRPFDLIIGYVKGCLSTRKEDYIKLRQDLRNEKAAREREEARVRKINANNKMKFEEKKLNIKEKELTPKFIDLIQMDKEGEDVVIPNCIMLVAPNSKLSDELIYWTGRNSTCNFEKINYTDDLLDHLENAEEKYQETGNRTLVYVKGFDKLINPQISPDHVIGGLKAIMSTVSDNYHSTIIFNTKNPEELDEIALQPHRINERIQVDFREPKLLKAEHKEKPVKKSKIDTHKGEYSSDKDFNLHDWTERDSRNARDTGTYRGGMGI